jgi:hypothetical protein
MDLFDYMSGDGRWASQRADCSPSRQVAWDSQAKQGDSEYYNGKGAGGRDSFDFGHVFSDGCSADFKCAGLLLFLSSLTTLQFRILWNWFGSSHGKTDECDAGGGSYKRALDGIELSGDGFYDDAKRIVLESRRLLSEPQGNFFWKEDGVYRRWYHHIPIRGAGSINRVVREAADGDNITLLSDSRTKFPISSIHRVMTQGWSNHLYAACRSCYTCGSCSNGEYVGSVDGEGGGSAITRQNCVPCASSRNDKASGISFLDGQCSHELKEIIIESKSAQDNQYTRLGISDIASRVFNEAEKGHILAMETQSDTEPFWLVRVVERHEQLACDSTFEDWGVEFNCKQGERALTVTKLFVSSPTSTNAFCDHVNARYLQVPAALLRVSDLVNSGKMLQTEVAVRSSRSRASARAIVGDSSKQFIYEFKAGARQHVVLKCRALELPS